MASAKNIISEGLHDGMSEEEEAKIIQEILQYEANFEADLKCMIEELAGEIETEVKTATRPNTSLIEDELAIDQMLEEASRQAESLLAIEENEELQKTESIPQPADVQQEGDGEEREKAAASTWQFAANSEPLEADFLTLTASPLALQRLADAVIEEGREEPATPPAPLVGSPGQGA